MCKRRSKALKINTWRRDNIVNEAHVNAVIHIYLQKLMQVELKILDFLNFFGKLSQFNLFCDVPLVT
jgi:hypothetical protein